MFEVDDITGTQEECEGLLERAARLYPESPYLQQEWLRAVLTVRMTVRGWLLDGAVSRAGAAA